MGKPVRKKFSRALYEAYDSQAKDALTEYLTKKGHVLVNTEENYNVDVVSQKHGYTYFNEAEVKKYCCSSRNCLPRICSSLG